MPFGQIVIGPPGSGKSTYCNGMKLFLNATGRKTIIVNLDAANENLPYECEIDIQDLISIENVMKELHLGPNGGIIYCMEYLVKNMDWLKEKLDQYKDHYVLFDFPGQIELFTVHDSVRELVEEIQEWNYRVSAVHLVDSIYCSDPAKYISALLVSLSSMVRLELPHVNVLSKIDLLESFGDLAYDLEYYTDVQNLSYIVQNMKDPKYLKMNQVIVELIEDYSLVSFLTLNIQEKQSVNDVLKVIDKSNGYVFTNFERSQLQNAVYSNTKFTILSTSDLHSSFDPYYPRMAHFVQKYRDDTKQPTLLLDAGDWYSGTLFKLIGISYMFPNEAPELEFFKYLKFDATTLGNHEFDAKQKGLTFMIKKTDRIGGFDLPILTSNIEFDEHCDIERIRKKKSGVYMTDHIIKTLTDTQGNNIKVAIIGIYGPNSALFSMNNRDCLHFAGFNDTGSVDIWHDYVTTIYNLVQDIRAKHNVDLVISLSHSGSPEDSKLIKSLSKLSKIPVIDIHISSHTHEIYGKYEEGTYIFQNDNQAKEMGILEMEYLGRTANPRIRITNPNLMVDFEKYTLVDPHYVQIVKRYKRLIDDIFLSQIPYDSNTDILQFKRTPFKDDFEFGTFLVSSILKQLNKESQEPTSLFSTKMEKVDIYFNSIACVRALPEFYHPNKTVYFHEIFRMLGIGHLDIISNQYNAPGDPIVHFWVHKSMINTLVTATRLYSLLDSAGWFVFSDTLTFDWSWWGIPFVNMATNIRIHGKSYEDWPEYVHIASPLIIAEFVPKAKQLTFGWVDLSILDKWGRVLKNGINDQHTYFKEYLLLANHWKELKSIS